ncbi:PREDICTED: uncharacterized protein LOC109220924 [Nicotiana attenuata]|uniref:uncharacterized protein LOC109220924 n=1 Tax=Nicotiana attenuata TaxID=49451 RepID=UPI0009052425|nr:PREDICTED: uncharacterized protein LOC109220924 [Nicotiana attenuata]
MTFMYYRRGGGTSRLDFARAFDLVVANSSFSKREEYLVTFRSTVAKIQIDYLICRKCDRYLCTDCKVISSECLTIQHRLSVMDPGIKRNRKKRAVCSQPRIKWGILTKDKAHELGWNTEVQGKVEVKKAAYLKLVESANEEEKRTNWECDKKARKEAKLAVTTAKTAAFGRMYAELGSNGRDKKLYKHIKVDEVMRAMIKMSRGRVTGPDKILVESWKIAGRAGVEWLTGFFNVIFKTKKMPE